MQEDAKIELIYSEGYICCKHERIDCTFFDLKITVVLINH